MVKLSTTIEFRCENKMYKRLKQLARVTKHSMSYHIREALEGYGLDLVLTAAQTLRKRTGGKP